MLSSLLIESGNFFTSEAEVFVCPVALKNETLALGLPGEFLRLLPGFRLAYDEAISEGTLDFGNPSLRWSVNPKWYERYVMFFPIKYDARNPADMDYIEAGLIKFQRAWNWHRLCHSWAFPAFGVDDGLEWKDTKRVMVNILKEVNTQVIIYE